jgi:hypothetical protein
LIEPLKNTSLTEVQISKEVGTFFKAIHTSFEKNKDHLHANFDDYQRKGMLDELGQAGSNFREQIYSKGFSGEKEILSLQELQSFIQLGIQYTNHAIKANKRNDNLYHAYNLMTINDDNSVSISYLSEMLEGQVAILSTDALDPEETLNVLDALKSSKLFREDQYSYLLYPNKDIAKFQDRNQIPPEKLEGSFLCTEMIKNKDFRIIEKDLNGDFHFNANFKNANDLKDQLEILANENYLDLVPKEKKFYLDLYEETFKHKSFTGRSGTFFGYEGLGSIYWHMVSKLQLAAQECCLAALQKKASPEIIGRLLAHYYEINEGIGCHKSPALYGAFPTDPYSHTPAGKGAQQPGMTGQVKEDILSRFGELGVVISEGKLSFKPDLLRKEEFLKEDKIFNYFNVDVEQKVIQLQAGSLCFTYCQVPILYKIADQNKLIITNQSNEALEFDSWTINSEFSSHIFNRTNEVKQVLVQIKKSYLK